MTEPGPLTYVHDALFYRTRDELVNPATAFLREGLARGEHVALVCSEANNRFIAQQLGNDPRLSFLSRDTARPGAPEAIATFRRLAERSRAEGSQRVRLVGEVGLTPATGTWRDWTRFEAERSAELSSLPLWCVCAYDVRALPDEVVTAGELTHPYVRRDGSRIPNPSYVHPADFLRRLGSDDADPVELTEPVLVLTDLRDLQATRECVRAIATATDAAPSIVENFVLAVNELAGNAVRHGRQPVSLRLWVTPSRLLCAVFDTGGGFHDPGAGHLAPDPDDLPEGRYGLWLVRQLTDHMSMSSSPVGFTIRISATYARP